MSTCSIYRVSFLSSTPLRKSWAKYCCAPRIAWERPTVNGGGCNWCCEVLFVLRDHHHPFDSEMSDYSDDDDVFNPYESDDEMVMEVRRSLSIRFRVLDSVPG